MGLPLIAHSILCAARSKSLQRTIVSTDSEEVALVARAHGAEVPFMRPPELSHDRAPTFPVLTHALAAVEQSTGQNYDYVCLLEPTSPGRLPEDIDRAVEQLKKTPGAQGVVACAKPSFNAFWTGVINEGGYMKPAFQGANAFDRRQDVPEFYHITGALYVWRAAFVRSAPTLWRDSPHVMLEMPESRAFSIDDLFQFEAAEAIISRGLVKLPWLDEVRS